jgi:hypothetical protein
VTHKLESGTEKSTSISARSNYIYSRYTDENGWVLCKNLPQGMEINHKCGNRGCCNLEHLELICGSKHATLTNVNRVGDIMERRF